MKRRKRVTHDGDAQADQLSRLSRILGQIESHGAGQMEFPWQRHAAPSAAEAPRRPWSQLEFPWPGPAH